MSPNPIHSSAAVFHPTPYSRLNDALKAKLPLTNLTNETAGLSAKCSLSHCAGDFRGMAAGKAQAHFVQVIRDAMANKIMGSGTRVALEKSAQWATHGGEMFGTELLYTVQALGATHTALEYLSKAEPNDTAVTKALADMNEAILELARKAGQHRAPPSGNHGPGEKKAFEATLAAQQRMVECFNDVGPDKVLSAVSATLVAGPLSLAIRERMPDVFARLKAGDDANIQIHDLLKTDDANDLGNKFSRHLSEGTFDGYAGAILDHMAMPDLVKQPQPGKPADKAPPVEQAPPDLPPNLAKIAGTGAPIAYNNINNNFSDLIKALGNTDQFELGRRFGNLEAQLQVVSNKLDRAVERIDQLEKDNGDLRARYAQDQQRLNAAFARNGHDVWPTEDTGTILSQPNHEAAAVTTEWVERPSEESVTPLVGEQWAGASSTVEPEFGYARSTEIMPSFADKRSTNPAPWREDATPVEMKEDVGQSILRDTARRHSTSASWTDGRASSRRSSGHPDDITVSQVNASRHPEADRAKMERISQERPVSTRTARVRDLVQRFENPQAAEQGSAKVQKKVRFATSDVVLGRTEHLDTGMTRGEAPNLATAVKGYLDQLALSSEEREGERTMYGTPGRSHGQKAFVNRTDAPSGTVPERTLSVEDFNRYLVDSGLRSREAGQVARDITHSPQPADEGAEVRDAFAQFHASRSSGSESLVSALRRQGTFVKADGRSEAARQAAAVETGRVTSQPRSSQTARTMPDTVSSLFSSAAISVMQPSQSDAVKSFRTSLHLSINGAGSGPIRRRDSVESVDSDAMSEDSRIGGTRYSPSSDNGEFDFNDVGTTGSESGPLSPSDNMVIQKSAAQYPGVSDLFTYVQPQSGMRFHFGSEVGSDDPAVDREITEIVVDDLGVMDNRPLTLGGQNVLETLRRLQPFEEPTRSGSTLQATSSWPQP